MFQFAEYLLDDVFLGLPVVSWPSRSARFSLRPIRLADFVTAVARTGEEAILAYALATDMRPLDLANSFNPVVFITKD